MNRGRAFTLLELLLVIGIIGLLAGILLPAVNKTYQRAIVLRTQADLQAIATGLEAYKADYGVYPPLSGTVYSPAYTGTDVSGPNSGAAVLGKALLGPMDEAHYYTAAGAAIDNLQNPPAVFDPAKTYQAGDVVLVGTAPTYAIYTTAQPAPGASIFVCVRNETNGSAHAPTGGAADSWWTRFVPYDGLDGNGARNRLAAIADNNGLPHASAGKAYGPYLEAGRFKTNGPVILDRNGSPILYFTVDKLATPTQGLGFVSRHSYPRVTTPVASREPLSMINANDNLGAFADDSATPVEPVATLFAKVAITLGDYNTNGSNNPGAEPPVPQVPYLLWTAGADKRFGPPGARNPTSWKRGDFFDNGSSSDLNQITSAAIDDVTNFR